MILKHIKPLNNVVCKIIGGVSKVCKSMACPTQRNVIERIVKRMLTRGRDGPRTRSTRSADGSDVMINALNEMGTLARIQVYVNEAKIHRAVARRPFNVRSTGIWCVVLDDRKTGQVYVIFETRRLQRQMARAACKMVTVSAAETFNVDTVWPSLWRKSKEYAQQGIMRRMVCPIHVKLPFMYRPGSTCLHGMDAGSTKEEQAQLKEGQPVQTIVMYEDGKWVC